MEGLFREKGLPQAIRSDNGAPFERGAGRVEPAGSWESCPSASAGTSNGRQRLHRTLKAETANPPGKNRRAQQVAFDQFRCE